MKWVLTNRPVLVEAARRIINLVLNNHIRTRRYEQVDEFSDKMVSDIIDQLCPAQGITSGAGNVSVPTAEVSKRPRGRPRKKKILQPSVEDDNETGPRTRKKSARLIGTLGLLAAPAFTTSPVKSTQQKVRPI
jgi:hypothetical protein